jgi:hypothetical protein
MIRGDKGGGRALRPGTYRTKVECDCCDRRGQANDLTTIATFEL